MQRLDWSDQTIQWRKKRRRKVGCETLSRGAQFAAILADAAVRLVPNLPVAASESAFRQLNFSRLGWPGGGQMTLRRSELLFPVSAGKGVFLSTKEGFAGV